MARAKGFQGIVGRILGSVWNTAVECAAGSGVEVLSLSADGNASLIEDLQITGRITQREGNAGNRSAGCTLRTGLRYEGNEFDIAQVFGTAGTPATVDTSAYQHVFKINDDMDGIFATLAFELVKDTIVVEVPSVKWNRLTLRGRQNERLELELQGIGSNWKADSTVNTTTTIDTVTLPSNREFATMPQVALEMNDASAGALGSSPVYISGFELTFERAMEARYSTQFGNQPDEPIETGFAKVSGSFEFAHLQSGTGGNTGFMDDQMALTRKKATITITSPNLAGAATQAFQHKLWLPNLQFGEAKPGITGPEGLRWSIPFMAYHVDSAPTGFTAGYVDAVTWENYSQESGDPLS